MATARKTPLPRFRTRGDDLTVVRYTREVLSGAPSGNGVVGNSTACGVGRSEAMHDVVTPKFKTLQGDGEVVFNPMQRVEHAVSSSGSGQAVRYAGTDPALQNVVYTCEGDWMMTLVHSSRTGNLRARVVGGHLQPWYFGVTADESLALQRAVAIASTQAHAIPSDAELLVALAEWRKTLRALPDLLDGWRKLFARINAREAAFSRKRTASRNQDAARNMRDLIDELMNTWLMARFAVRPLIADTLGVINAARRKRSDDFVRATKRGASAYTADSSTAGEFSYGVTRTPILEQSTINVSVRAMNLWEAVVSRMDDLGVNLAHVPLALVDLTRFSFVLNWVVNVNDVAAALGSAVQPGWKSLGGCYVVRREASTLYMPTGPTYSTNTQYAIKTPLTGHILSTSVEKRRVPGLPNASLSIRPDPMGWAKDFRLLDAVGLLRQQAKGRGVSLLAQFGHLAGAHK